MNRFHRPGTGIAVAAMTFLVTLVGLSVSSRSQTNWPNSICLGDDSQTPCPASPCAAGSYYCNPQGEPGKCIGPFPRSCIEYDERNCGYRYKCSPQGVPFDSPLKNCTETVIPCVSP